MRDGTVSFTVVKTRLLIRVARRVKKYQEAVNQHFSAVQKTEDAVSKEGETMAELTTT